MLLTVYRHRALIDVLIALLMFIAVDSSGTPRADANPDILREFLAGPMADVTEIVFAVRRVGEDPHWYANFGYYGPDANRKAYEDGAKLYLLNLRTGALSTLLADATGG